MQTNTPPPSSSPDAVRTLLSWDAPAVPHHNRSPRWYAAAGVVVLIAVMYGIFAGAWTVAVVALLVGAMYLFVLRGAQPPLKHCSLTTHGVSFDGAFTRWEDCAGFWMVATPHATTLHIARSHPRQRDISIVMENVDPQEVRWTLARFLSERTDRHEHFLDMIIRICKL